MPGGLMQLVAYGAQDKEYVNNLTSVNIKFNGHD